jgi:diguanylate cyclase (GGDEF)-like protein
VNSNSPFEYFGHSILSKIPQPETMRSSRLKGRMQTFKPVSDEDALRHAQRYRMRGVIGAVLVSALWAVWVATGSSNGLFPLPIAVAAASWVFFCGLIFSTLIKTDLNLRLPDSGLSMYCLLAATLGVLVAMHYGVANLRSASYTWAVIAFSVGNLSSTFRSVRLTAIVVVTMALIEYLIHTIKNGFAFEPIWQVIVFCFATLFIAYAIVVVGKRAAAATRRLEHSALVLDTISEAVFTLDLSGNVQSLNHAAAELCEGDIRIHIGKPLSGVLRSTSNQDAQAIDNLLVASTNARANRRRIEANLSQFSIEVMRDGQAQSVKFESHLRLVFDADGKVSKQVVVLRDITHVSLLISKLQYETTHDDLTGLLNRRGLSTELLLISEAMRSQKLLGEHALLVVDLDQFKLINDTCGHLAGDQLLKSVALVLADSVRHGDLVARQGGDEFAVLMRETSEQEVSEVANKILRAVSQLDFQWTRRKFKCGASIGASMINQSNLDVNQSVLRADSALYLAKDLGRGRFQMYREDDTNVLKKTRELAWVTRIHQALTDNHFELFAQQVKALAGEHHEHYEILLRLPNAHHGFDSPEEFMPSAERFELMPLIDRWVIGRAINAITAQPIGAGNSNMTISINLSAQSLLDSDFPTFLEQALTDSKFPSDRLYLEIDESIAANNIELAQHFIASVRKLGCHVALDEVGHGYNTRSDLRQLACDFIKLDSRLSKDLESNGANQELIESIFNFSQEANVKAVAKKVEPRYRSRVKGYRYRCDARLLDSQTRAPTGNLGA